MLQAYWQARPVESWKSRLTVGPGYGLPHRVPRRRLRQQLQYAQPPGHVGQRCSARRRTIASASGLGAAAAAARQRRHFGLGDQRREVEIARLGYLGRLGPNSLQVNVRADDYSDFGKADTHFLGYGFDFTDAWRFTAAASTAFRAPTFQDLYGFGGNPLLKPERARTKELGVQWAQGPQRLRVVAFDTEYEDAISFDLQTFTAANVRKASVNGRRDQLFRQLRRIRPARVAHLPGSDRAGARRRGRAGHPPRQALRLGHGVPQRARLAPRRAAAGLGIAPGRRHRDLRAGARSRIHAAEPDRALPDQQGPVRGGAAGERARRGIPPGERLQHRRPRGVFLTAGWQP